MEKTIKDYLPYYIGCQIQTPIGAAELIGVEKDAVFTWEFKHGRKVWSYREVKPHLINIRSVKRKQLNHLMSYEYWNDIPDDIDNWFGARTRMVTELLNMRVDLFGLIDAGLAIDAKSLTTPTPKL